MRSAILELSGEQRLTDRHDEATVCIYVSFCCKRNKWMFC